MKNIIDFLSIDDINATLKQLKDQIINHISKNINLTPKKTLVKFFHNGLVNKKFIQSALNNKIIKKRFDNFFNHLKRRT